MAEEGENPSLCFPFHSQMRPGSPKKEDTRKQVKTILLSFAFGKSVWSSFCVPGLGAQWLVVLLLACVLTGHRPLSLSMAADGLDGLLRVRWVTRFPGREEWPRGGWL